jgi:Restriction endonuclease
MNLYYEFNDLKVPPTNADATWYQQRGYALERILNALLARENLNPRLSYRIDGEQIDGSFSLGTQFFLTEAKWHSKPLPASALYTLYGKVNGKLSGTLGVFISLSGYSDGAPDALALGKQISVILFDQSDFEVALGENKGFTEVLLVKLRAAAEEGLVYFPYKSKRVEEPKQAIVNEDTLQHEAHKIVTVVCEGQLDAAIVRSLAARLIGEKKLTKGVKTVIANGKLMAPRAANMLYDTNAYGEQLVVLVDSDGDVASTERMLRYILNFQNQLLSIPDPTIEAWLGLDSRQFKDMLSDFQQKGVSTEDGIRNLVMSMDFQNAYSSHTSFRVLIDALTN